LDCFIKTTGHACVTKEDLVSVHPAYSASGFSVAQLRLMTLGLGYGVRDEKGTVIPSPSDPAELVSCYDDEAGEYYCRMAAMPLYQYDVPKSADAFALSGSLTYSSQDWWCRGWKNEASCTTSIGSGGSFCWWDTKGDDEAANDACLAKPIQQPRCARALANTDCFKKNQTECGSSEFKDRCEWLAGICQPREFRNENVKMGTFSVIVTPGE
jgi:hypothetical protein